MALTITPLGAARTVTGSRHLIDADGLRILVDCGLYQEREFLGRNWEPFPVSPASIDAVLLTHAHLDHSGYLPVLVRDGFRGPILCTAATAALVLILLADSARLQVEDAAYKQRRHAREGRRGGKHGPARALYEPLDAERVASRLRVVSFGTRQPIGPQAWATWLPAGHILGAGIILVEAGGKRVVFSGDLGRKNRPIVPDPADPPEADAIVVESTYGDRLHAPDADVAGQLAEVVGTAVAAGGKVLLPTFAIERAQEIIWHLDNLHTAGRLPAVPVFLDSPMAVDVLAEFARHEDALDADTRRRLRHGDTPFSFDSLRLCRSAEESKAINDIAGPAVIIAGSGMCNGGRIKHHLQQHLEDPNSCILFTGYQAHGTLGRQIVDGADYVRLFNRDRAVRLRVAQLQGCSGHADRDECVAWLAASPRSPSRVIVIHGGRHVAPAFATLVQERLKVPAHAPEYGEVVTVA